MTLAAAFVKYYSVYFVSNETTPNTNPLVASKIQQSATKILVAYYETIRKHLIFEHDRLKKIEATNDDFAIARGEMTDDRKETFERRKKFYEKLRAAAQAISGPLGLEMPDLKEDEAIIRDSIGITEGGRVIKEEKDIGIWGDEESKAFYEDLVDLANVVPGVLLGQKPPQSGITAAVEAADKDLEKDNDAEKEVNTEEAKEEEAANEEVKDEEDESVMEGEEKVGGNVRATMDGIILRLPSALNKEIIDSIAVEFAVLLHNSSISTERLPENDSCKLFLPFRARDWIYFLITLG
jgi:regulator of nonsense transcripts 2